MNPPPLHALSLHQPWATLAAHGLKQHETRSWSTRHRGPLAVHAAVSRPAYARAFMHDSVECRRALRLLGYRVDGDDLPRGGVVGLVDVADCQPTPPSVHGIDLIGSMGATLFAPENVAVPADEEDLAFGDWSPGRYAWRLEHPQALRELVPVRGRQGLWQLTPAESAVVRDAAKLTAVTA